MEGNGKEAEGEREKKERGAACPNSKACKRLFCIYLKPH